MSSLVTASSKSDLTLEKLSSILQELKSKLQGRVAEPYIFGSAAGREITLDSDIDLIFIVENPTRPFVERAFDFLDLFVIYPRMDILVYTPDEFQKQLSDSDTGFWKSVRLSLKRIV